MNSVIVGIDCQTFSLVLHKVISSFGIGISINRFCDGYIIHGELEILKLSDKFELEWSFSGADIFVTEDEGNSFYIEKDIIHVTDWEGNKYKIDKFGVDVS